MGYPISISGFLIYNFGSVSGMAPAGSISDAMLWMGAQEDVQSADFTRKTGIVSVDNITIGAGDYKCSACVALAIDLAGGRPLKTEPPGVFKYTSLGKDLLSAEGFYRMRFLPGFHDVDPAHEPIVQRDDILVVPSTSLFGNGHVVVVREVDSKTGEIVIVECNENEGVFTKANRYRIEGGQVVLVPRETHDASIRVLRSDHLERPIEGGWPDTNEIPHDVNNPSNPDIDTAYA